MQQHLITIDLDGTTLNDQSEISNVTERVLRYVSELGHLVCIVTGRPYRNSRQYYEQLNIPAPIVNFNGALCHFPGYRYWIPRYHVSLDRDVVMKLVEHCQNVPEISLISVEGRNEIYTTSYDLPKSPYYPVDLADVNLLGEMELSYNPTAVTVFSEEKYQPKIVRDIEALFGDEISIRTWGGSLPCLEIVRKGINKAVGVKRVAEFYRIPKSAILAFGDEENDLEMLEYAGLGVAMKNGKDTVKAVADTVTEYTNDEDGLARFLVDYFGLLQHLLEK